MGSRMVSAAESPVHDNWKQAILAAKETDTVSLNPFSRPGLRALRTWTTERLEREEHVGMDVFARAMDLYFGGDMEAAIALGDRHQWRACGARRPVSGRAPPSFPVVYATPKRAT